jgi:hypothetical protein
MLRMCVCCTLALLIITQSDPERRTPHFWDGSVISFLPTGTPPAPASSGHHPGLPSPPRGPHRRTTPPQPIDHHKWPKVHTPDAHSPLHCPPPRASLSPATSSPRPVPPPHPRAPPRCRGAHRAPHRSPRPLLRSATVEPLRLNCVIMGSLPVVSSCLPRPQNLLLSSPACSPTTSATGHRLARQICRPPLPRALVPKLPCFHRWAASLV